jgi:hypothetical protein
VEIKANMHATTGNILTGTQPRMLMTCLRHCVTDGTVTIYKWSLKISFIGNPRWPLEYTVKSV